MPALLQVYVAELDKKLEIAKNNGAEIVTSATDFYGGKLARFIDPQGNLWWLFELEEYDESDWTAEDLEDDDAAWKQGDDPTMAYIHDSLVDALEKISKIE